MAEVDRLLREFKDEHERSGAGDPQPYLESVSGRDRVTLETLIETYLASAPRRAWNEAEFEAAGTAPLVEGIEQSLAGSAGTWPALLPRLRARAELARADLTARLAESLGVGDRKEKVHSYYHQMEVGTLPAEGVSQRVLDALGRIVGESGDALRRAGTGMAGPGPEAEGRAFARTARAAEFDAGAPAAGGAPREPDADDWDEVDQLFRAGR
jgi:hypothetical protein